MKQRIPVLTAAVILCLTLISTCLTCGMYARYTTGGTSTNRARVANFGQLKLDLETTQGGMLLPGQTAKATLDPKVTMTESEVAVVVYVYVTLPNDSGWTYNEEKHSFACGPILWTVEENWAYRQPNEDQTYTFYRFLAPGKKLDAVPFVAGGEMDAPQNYDDYYQLSDSDVNLDITFKARAVQID